MLSVIARQGCSLLAVLTLSTAAELGLAETEIQVSSPPTYVENPFATGAPPADVVADEPEMPRRGPTTYQNPFATMTSAPPIEIPMRPGPVSRWRRRFEPLDDTSPVKAAILSADPFELPQVPWNELPTNETWQERVAASRAMIDSPAAGHFGQPPDPVDFAAQPLHQPGWLAPSRAAEVRPLPPIGQAVTADQTMHDPFELPSHALAGPALGAAAPLSQTVLQCGPGSAETNTVIISDYAQSADDCLAEAQRLAQSAESVDELSDIADHCQRGLAEAPPDEIASALRRLAAWAHNRRGELSADQGQQSEAARDFQIAISLDPQCSLAIHNRAVTLAQQNESAAALRDFNRVIELNPGLALAYRNRAELLSSLGRIDEAVRDYDQAIEGIPEDAELYRARAAAWQRLGDHHRALADLDQAIQLAPDHPDAYTQRGNIAAEQGDFDQALGDFRRALAVDADWTEAYRSLAWLQATCPNPRYRDAEQAIASAQHAQKLSPPGDCFVLEALAAAHAASGAFDEAVYFQKQAIAAAPPDFAEPLQQRLTLYEQKQPFINEPAAPIHTATQDSDDTQQE
jgi:tetratricopeptide (TPR) repeat protein